MVLSRECSLSNTLKTLAVTGKYSSSPIPKWKGEGREGEGEGKGRKRKGREREGQEGKREWEREP